MNNISRFNEIWDCELHVGMRLEILDRTDFDVYDCVVTRLEDDNVWVKRDDKDDEELVDDLAVLQTPGEDEDDDKYDEDYEIIYVHDDLELADDDA